MAANAAVSVKSARRAAHLPARGRRRVDRAGQRPPRRPPPSRTGDQAIEVVLGLGEGVRRRAATVASTVRHPCRHRRRRRARPLRMTVRHRLVSAAAASPRGSSSASCAARVSRRAARASPSSSASAAVGRPPSSGAGERRRHRRGALRSRAARRCRDSSDSRVRRSVEAASCVDASAAEGRRARQFLLEPVDGPGRTQLAHERDDQVAGRLRARGTTTPSKSSVEV